MKFKINGSTYLIREVPQEEFARLKEDDEDTCYFGQSNFMTQEVLLDESLSLDRKKKTLYHELMHVYIKEYLMTMLLKNADEEIICDLSANSHDIIHEIVEKYFEKKKTRFAFKS